MIKLMKYEFRKTLFVKLIVLAAAALAEIAFLIGVLGDRERMTGTGIVLLTMLALGGIIRTAPTPFSAQRCWKTDCPFC